MAERLSIFSPGSYRSGTCGYCSPPGQRSIRASSYTTGADAYVLTCNVGGDLVLIATNAKTDGLAVHTIQYGKLYYLTQRLEVLNFAPTRSQRKVLYRWNRFVLEGGSDEDILVDGTIPSPPKSRNPKKTPSFSFLDAVHASEVSFCKKGVSPKHKFEITLEPSSYTKEKYDLFQKYQGAIHKDRRNSPHSFDRFLVETPLMVEPIAYAKEPPSHLPKNYGSYHMLYRLDGELVAMAVLDILPKCVSSVYFMYDNDWEQYSFGKMSAMREATLAREMYEHGALDLKYLYLGYYIHSCQKMRYKAEYSPSFLLDPISYSWHPYETTVPILDNNHFACFANPEISLKEKDTTPYNARPLAEADAARILVLQDQRIVKPFLASEGWKSDENREQLAEVTEAMGPEITGKSAFIIY